MTPLLPSQKPLRLLLLGDNDFFRSLLNSHLNSNQSVLVEATASCDDLLSRLNNKLDLLVVDESLEDCKLDELLSVIRLRADQLPVIVLTIDPASTRKLRLLESGATEVVVKDESTNELLDRAIENQLVRIQLQMQVDQLKKRLEGISLSTTSGQVSGIAITGEIDQTLEKYTMEIIRHFLGRYNNNVVLVAKKLDVGKSTIYRYLKENKLTLSGSPMPSSDPAIASRMAGERSFSVSGNPAVFSKSKDNEAVQSGVVMEPSVNANEDVRSAFNYLQRISKGNPSFVVNMTTHFIHSMKTLLALLHAEMNTENRLRMLHQLTKMKSSLDSMGMKSLGKHINRLREVLNNELDKKEFALALEGLSTHFSYCESALLSEKAQLENSVSNTNSSL